MLLSRKRRNLLSKKRKNGKRNTKRNTKTRKNMRNMRGGADTPIKCGGINISIGTEFDVNNANGVNNIHNDETYKVISINKEADKNNPVFELALLINLEFGRAIREHVNIPFSALNTCVLVTDDGAPAPVV